MRRDAFQAIADPNRRAIIHLLSTQTLTPNAIAENFAISRPAISKHIKMLEECGLVVIKKKGRERYCEAKLDSLAMVMDWAAQYLKSWDKRLDSLENYLETLQKKNKKHDNK